MREKLLAAIRKHVASEYPKEACGLIIQSGRTQTYMPCRNIADDPMQDFTLSHIYVGENLMLHHNSESLSTRAPYGDYWRNRTVRVVRRRELMNA
ncbi:hypothetical protein WB91_23335 [bacteria symbiont BFo1 of Frankliniella occidentalis]|nr:hypothetical protein WB91_23335 [bacteria symbiont BFo1 of Frankliniella occidentalis]